MHQTLKTNTIIEIQCAERSQCCCSSTAPVWGQTSDAVFCLQVRKVYLLVRGKKHLTAHERVQKLLCGPLFHKLHAEAAEGGRNPFSRVHAVAGDLELPGLGLSPADREQLVCDVDVVIHAAASLTLDARIQDALRWVVPQCCGAPALLPAACKWLASFSSCSAGLHPT